LSTQENTERLLESIAQDRAGNITVRELDLGEKRIKHQKRKFVSATAVNSAAKKKK
jgi:hypothetical protein